MSVKSKPLAAERRRSTPGERGYRCLDGKKEPEKVIGAEESTEPKEVNELLKGVSGLYVTIDERLSKRFTLSFANNLCFRLRLLFIVFNLDTVIGAQLGTPTFVTFLPDMACAKKFGIGTEAYLDAVEELLQDWLLQVIVTIFSEANYLLKEGRDEAEILSKLCPWYSNLKESANRATSIDDVQWLSWIDPAIITVNRRAERRARKEKAKANGGYRPDNKVVDQLQRMEEYKNLAISVAAKAAARQAYATVRKSAARQAEHTAAATGGNTPVNSALIDGTPVDNAPVDITPNGAPTSDVVEDGASSATPGDLA